jgi:ribose-phosphate pyrophosphokinase
MNSFVIAFNNSNSELGVKLCEIYNMNKNLITEQKFANGEINIKLNESVRGKTVYLICSGSYNKSIPDFSINDNIISIILIIDALKRSSAKAVNLIIPCYPYARSDKKDHRGPISSSAIAMIFEKLSVDRIISCDIHSGQIQGFFQKAFDNIYCMNILISHLKANVFNNCDDINKEYILCSPDIGSIKRIKAYSNKLKLNYFVMDKQRDYSTINVVTQSIIYGDLSQIKNKTVVIIDDMADTLGTLCSSINEIKQHAKNCIIVVTHGYFSGDALEKINNTEFIKNVICTNSICQTENIKKCNKISVIDISNLLCNVIECIEKNISISSLFE